ncbi:hypothetical protein ACIQVL_10770 [Streptomyces sp. NPDC090499]|uniref:hypothetical protein n=1 Tax=Streptomyces sp. NPDC090499 TaxID=3365965 RepID=UPI00380413AA
MTSMHRTAASKAPAGTPPTSRVKAWGLTSGLMLLYLINYGDKVLLGVAAQPLKDELGLSASQIGLAGSVFILRHDAGGFLAGPAVKHAPLKWVLATLAVGWPSASCP